MWPDVWPKVAQFQPNVAPKIATNVLLKNLFFFKKPKSLFGLLLYENMLPRTLKKIAQSSHTAEREPQSWTMIEIHMGAIKTKRTI